MKKWKNTYRPTAIGQGDTITDSAPGDKIAKALTEVQEYIGKFSEKQVTICTNGVVEKVWVLVKD